MRCVLNLLMAIFFCSPFSAQAQNKYALLVGINDYYQSPGVKHPSSLHGCVNDALSMQELLLNRFHFAKENIYTLFDSAATRTAVLNLMQRVLNKTAAGDAVVFYYSGHGVWMNNAFQLDSVKRKMSQAMAMSNLYAPELGCLLTDEDLKTVFNRFVDKKVIATALLDCCYSGFMIAPPVAPQYKAQYWWPAVAAFGREKSINLNEIDYINQRQKPAGCPVGSANGSLADTDGDGVPDCRDWQSNTPHGAPVDSLGIASAEDYIAHTTTDPRFVGFSTDSATAVAQARAFNLKDDLTVNYLPKAARPADREGSRFLSLAASTDYQKAAEITDETGMKHGAFTKALLTIYKDSPVALNVSALIDKIAASLKSQGYGQTPVYLSEKSRLSGNLIGISDKNFSNAITTICTTVIAGRLSFDKGLYAGLTKGSVLKSSDGKTVRLDSVTAVSSSGINGGKVIQAGEKFTLVDGYVSSAPVVKLYVPDAPFTQSGFAAFFASKISPVVAQAGYADYFVITYGAAQHVTLYRNEKEYSEFYKQAFVPAEKKNYTVVLLPLPSYIITPLKKMIVKNQNIQLVNSPADADYVLYLNYARKREGNEAAYIFYYRPRIDAQSEGFFALEKLAAPTLVLDANGLQALCESLYRFSLNTVRYKNADVWMNEQKRK